MGVGRDVDDWLVKVDILLRVSTFLPTASFFGTGISKIRACWMFRRWFTPAFTARRVCAPANESLFSLSEVKYVKVHTCSCMNSVGNVGETHRIPFRRFCSRHANSQDSFRVIKRNENHLYDVYIQGLLEAHSVKCNSPWNNCSLHQCSISLHKQNFPRTGSA